MLKQPDNQKLPSTTDRFPWKESAADAHVEQQADGCQPYQN
jgi:hypothetical protein